MCIRLLVATIFTLVAIIAETHAGSIPGSDLKLGTERGLVTIPYQSVVAPASIIPNHLLAALDLRKQLARNWFLSNSRQISVYSRRDLDATETWFNPWIGQARGYLLIGWWIGRITDFYARTGHDSNRWAISNVLISACNLHLRAYAYDNATPSPNGSLILSSALRVINVSDSFHKEPRPRGACYGSSRVIVGHNHLFPLPFSNKKSGNDYGYAKYGSNERGFIWNGEFPEPFGSPCSIYYPVLGAAITLGGVVAGLSGVVATVIRGRLLGILWILIGIGLDVVGVSVLLGHRRCVLLSRSSACYEQATIRRQESPSSQYRSPADLSGEVASLAFCTCGPPTSAAPASFVQRPSRCAYHGGEDVRILPVVVPEGEFVEVEREVALGDLMERAHDTALDERPEAVDVRGVDVAVDVLPRTVVDGAMAIAESLESLVAWILVGGDLDLVSNGLADESSKSRRVRVLDHLRYDVALARDGSDDGSLSSRTAPALPLLLPAADTSAVTVLGLAADVRFINLHDSSELDELLAPHGGADSVTHVPRGTVGTAPYDSMYLEGADPLLGGTHQVDDLEPGPQRVVGVLEDRSHERREPVALSRALLALPRPGTGEFVDFLVAATRARDASGPAHLDEVGPAGILGREPLRQLSECHHAGSLR